MTYPVLKSIAVLAGLLIAGGIFGARVYQLLWTNLRRGQPVAFAWQWGERIKGLLVYVAGQARLFRFLIPGTAHFFMFWGFTILSLTILQAIVEGLAAFAIPDFIFPFVGTFGPLALLQDLLVLSVIIAVCYALYLRLIVNPERYKGSHKDQAVLVLLFVLTIMFSLLVMNAVNGDLGRDPIADWRPISTAVGRLLLGLDQRTLGILGEFAYWLHLGTVLLFLTELPQGKHFHVVTSVPAVFLRRLEPAGRLPALTESEGGAGVSAIEHFSWRDMLGLYSCTECGRCQSVCPAYSTGLALSPKLLIMNLRAHLTERGAARYAPPTDAKAQSILGKSLLGDVIPEQALWNCTTCGACDQECPLFIEHVTPIVNMRRHLVSEGNVEAMLQDALANVGRYGNSFGHSERARAKWAQTTQPKIKDARREPVEYLWFVGDYASYSAGLADITRKTAEVFQKAGVDFGMMYDAERNSGNDVRRVGEEGLFEALVEKNMTALSKCTYQRIVTTDPHTYNALLNEYPLPTNGGRTVLHYSELLDELVASGKLKFSRPLSYRVTFHDPCYLGRYNNVYDAPRRVIAATGCQLVEMPRHRDAALCCGAGGGRIWMQEEPVKERASEARVREAAALDHVQFLVVACPKDMTMYRDAVKTTGTADRLMVRDLIELVHEAL